MKFVIGRALTILSWDNPVTAFFRKSRKLRHSLGRPSRSDFVQFEFYVVKKMSINLDIVFVAARRAETALAAERNEFKISAMRTGIHGAAVRRVTTMNHLVDIFQ